jgi:GTP1/Obg family GTP-binding protein
VSYSIENALFQWEEGEARIRQADPRESRELDRAARLVSDELRRRLGGAFTLDELADFYGEGTDWVSDEVQRRFSGTDTNAAVNAGFLRYAHHASDFAGGRRRLPEEEGAQRRG